MDNTWLFLTVALAFIAACGLYWRVQWQNRARLATDANQQLQLQLLAATRQLSELSHEVAQVRAQTREEAANNRASAAQVQAESLATLQRHVHNMTSLTQQELQSMRQSLQERLQELGGNVGQQLGTYQKTIMDVSEQLGGLSETAKNLHEVGKDIASLQDILRAPKLRGNLGELLLAEMLRQVLPTDAYELQYRLPGTERGAYVMVDAVIKLGDRLVPIDSKFPLETFTRLLEGVTDEERHKQRKLFVENLKRHIDSIARKYIRADAGTYDFALAYLPAENIYYEAVVREHATQEATSLLTYATSRKVIMVSPNTLYAYLLTVAYGLKGLRIEQQAEAMRGQLVLLQKKFHSFYESFGKVGRYLELAQRSYEDSQKRANRLQESHEQMTGVALDSGHLAAVVPTVDSICHDQT